MHDDPGPPLEPPVDLSALHPTRDPERLDRMRAAVLARAAAGLEARRRARSRGRIALPPLVPAYLVAATILLAALASLGVSRRAPRAEDEVSARLADALGLPRGLAAWVLTGEAPNSIQLARDVSAMEVERGR